MTREQYLLRKKIKSLEFQICCAANPTVRFNEDTNQVEYLDGNTWQPLSGDFWGLSGNSGVDAASQFVGTIDDEALVFRVNNQRAGIIGIATNFANPSSIATGSGGVALGHFALDFLTTNFPTGTLHLNTAIGAGAGRWIGYTGTNEDTPGRTASAENTLIGVWAGHYLQKRNDESNLGRNVAVGESAMYRSLGGSDNVFVGNFAGEASMKPRGNTGVGRDALRGLIDGYGNVAIGGLSQAYCSTGIKTIQVTNGGSGYTTANVVISAPLNWSTPSICYSTATAVATIDSGVITAITVTDPGCGYTSKGGIYPNGSNWAAGATVTIIGDGTGATAVIVPSTDMVSNEHNTSLGSSSGLLRRMGIGNLDLGYNAGVTLRYWDDYTIMIGTYSSVDSSIPAGTKVEKAVAIGYNAKVSTSNTMVLGGTGSDAVRVAVGAITADSSSVMDLTSTTQGFLPPRMTGLQAEAITSPAEGLMVYANNGNGATITSTGWWGYNGVTWVKLN